MAKSTTSKSTVDAATKTMDAMAAASKEVLENFVAAGNGAATKGYDKAFTFNKEQADAMTKTYDQAADFSKENVEAVVEAGNIAAKGMEAEERPLVHFTNVGLGVGKTRTALQEIVRDESPDDIVKAANNG